MICFRAQADSLARDKIRSNPLNEIFDHLSHYVNVDLGFAMELGRGDKDQARLR